MTLIYIYSYILVVFFVGLLPFNFLQKNTASLSEVSGLHLAAPGTIYTQVPPKKLSDIKKFTIHANLSSYLSEWNGYMRILAYEMNNDKMNFIVAQWDDSLVFQINVDGRPKPVHFETEEFFKKNQTTSLAIVYDGITLSSYRNGLKMKERQIGPLTFGNWNSKYPLLLGSDASGKYCWEGYIYSVNIFDRALSSGEIEKLERNNDVPPPLIRYSFRESQGHTVQDLGTGSQANLVVPNYFRPYKRDILDFDLTWLYEYRSYYIDLWINIIGFIPLGFLISVYLTKKRISYLSIILRSLLIGFGLSLSVELIQSLLPSRSSNLTDVIFNSFGAAIGAIIFKEARVLKRSKYLKFASIEDDKKALTAKMEPMHVIASIDNRHIFLLFAGLIALWMFYKPLRDLLSTYTETESYLYIILIPLISGYLVYEKWDKLASGFSYSWKTGTALMCVGLILFFVGKSNEVVFNKNDYASFITSSAGIFWIGTFILLYGLKTFRAALFPLMFLIAMIPIPTPLLKKIILLLQHGSAEVTSVILKLIQIPFTREGFIFYLPNNVAIEVAERCSGIHSSIALFIISTLASHLFLKTFRNRAILILSTFLITVMKNGIRISTLSLLGVYLDQRFLTQGFLHKSGGFVFYMPALVFLMLFLWLLMKIEKEHE